jgi:hypothetical protein
MRRGMRYQNAASFLKQLFKGPKSHLFKGCNVWVQWIGRQMIITLFSTSVWSSKGELQYAVWHLKAELTSLKFCVWGNVLWIACWTIPCQCMTISRSCTRLTLGGEPSPNSCFLLTSLNIRRRDRNWPAALQHSITVKFSLIPPDVKIWTLLGPFSVNTVSGFVIYLHANFLNLENVSRCVTKVIFGRYIFQIIAKFSEFRFSLFFLGLYDRASW